MLKTERVTTLLEEARAKSVESLERLADAEKNWDRRELLRSAERAWDAATQATNAVILSHSGSEPKDKGENDTFGMLSRLSSELSGLKPILDQYTDFSVYLYGVTISNASLDPLEFTIEDIRKAAEYIGECERMAGVADEDG